MSRSVTSPRACRAGFALDLGTTTIEGALSDLGSGEVLARGERANPQAAYGADVMTRLTLAMRSREAAMKMQALALNCAGEILRSLCKDAGVADENVDLAVLVGNTAMHHLALGLDVSTLATAPYKAAVKEASIVEVGAGIAAGLPPVYTAPLIGSYIGSDAIAAVLATHLSEGPTRMLIDVGTNTEVLLWHGGTLYAASAPAGPAFEGGEISCGMRARPGAIDSVVLDGRDLEVATVGGVTPKGICGSGLIDAIAALLLADALDSTGRLQPHGSLSGRIVAGEDGRPVAFGLAPSVTLTQKDIRAFQLAKGAVRAAAEILLREAGIVSADLEEVVLAGAFGTAVRTANALTTGMLPPVAPNAIRAVGNAALAGALLMVRSSDARAEAERLAVSAKHVELSLDPHFQDEFIQSLNFHMAMPQGTR